MSPLDSMPHANEAKTVERRTVSAARANQDVARHTIELRVIRQLFEALLFEQLIEFEFAGGVFRFSLGSTEYTAKGYIAGFGRIRLDQNSLRTVKGEQPYSKLDLAHILASLPTNEGVKAKLTEQLGQTIKLSLWNHEHLPKLNTRFGLSYYYLESQLDEGHPYHPCFKARTGFSLQDHQDYGPESAKCFQLHWLAIKKACIRQSLPATANDLLFWQQEIGLSGWLTLQAQMNQQQLSWTEYHLMPIHPWQWKALKDHQLSDALTQGDLAYLGAAGDHYQASISVRTLFNLTNPHKAHIKLPMNMVNTSALRKLDPHAVCSAPTISNWLQQAIQDDPFLQDNPLILLSEYAGVALMDETASDDSWQAQTLGQLGVIFRDSIEPHLKQNQQAMPFNALYAIEKNGAPLIQPIIEQYGVIKWLTQLIDVAIVPVWHLLVKHGLAVEAHGQNMVLVHSNGWPEALILRDFHDSMEYVESYLANPSLQPNFAQLNDCYQDAPANQYYWMDSVEALRELVIDTLFVFNLSELACVFERHFHFCEDDFWDLVYDRLQHYAQQGHCSQARLDQMPINQDQIFTESLIKKKLADTEADLFHHKVSNPFANKPPLTSIESNR